MIELQKIQIRKANVTDSDILTEIAFSAKRHWGYPDEYFQTWKNELTITLDYIHQNIIYKAQIDDMIFGFYSIIENKTDFYSGEILVKKGFWLEHIFIKPEFHRMGIGRLLIEHALSVSREIRISELLVFVDPYARGFYDKMGAEFLHESKSSIPSRLIPVYKLKIQQTDN